MNRQKLTKSIDVTKQKRASDYVNQDRFRKNRSAEFVAMTRGREWVKISPKQGSVLLVTKFRNQLAGAWHLVSFHNTWKQYNILAKQNDYTSMKTAHS